MKLKFFGLEAIVIAMVTLPAVAHHSFAMFDSTKTATVEGTVKKFQWANPHSWIYMSVPDAKGQPEDWAIELGAPNGLAKQGWTPKTLAPGMNVKVVIHPLRDGKAGGQFMSITLPDGKQMGGAQTQESAE